MLKLPKDLNGHPKSDALIAYLSAKTRPLLEGKSTQGSLVAFDAKLKAALALPLVQAHLVQGLEQLGKILDREKKGLDAVRQAKNEAPVARLSRLLLLSNDGSERFYHDVASLAGRHAERVAVLVVETDAGTLGSSFAQKGQPAKAFMIADRKALGEFLKQLADAL